MPPLRVAIWLAVSTEAQAQDDKDSLPSQLSDATTWAEQNEYQISHTFEVPGHTRSYARFSQAAGEIPAYRQLETACEEGAFDVLWCRERSRLGRTRALIATVEAIVTESGAEVYSAKMPHAIGTASRGARGLLGAIEGWQAEDEIAQLVYRHKMGIRSRLKRGLPANHWPTGYEAVKDAQGKTIGGRFTEQADAIRYMTQLFLQGVGYSAIVQMMNESPYRPPRARRWHTSTVYQALNNDMYGGVVHYAGQRHESDKFPPLWDAETFEAVKRERQRRRQKRGGQPYKSAVSGVVVCGRCGARMIVNRPGGGRYNYLRCRTHAQRSYTGKDCHANSIPESRVLAHLDAFLEWAREAGRDELIARLDTGDTGRTEIEAEREKCKKAIEGIREQQDILAGYSVAQALPPDVVGRKSNELLETLAKWQRRFDELTDELDRAPSPEQRAAALWPMVESDRPIGEWEPAEARLMLQRARLRVVVESGKVLRIE